MLARRPLQLSAPSLLVPASCGGCGDALAVASARAAPAWCEHCRARWGPAPGWWATDGGTCAGWAAASYRGRVRRAVLQAKRGAPGALVDLLLARWPAGELPLEAVVTWVPAHPRRVIGRPDGGRVMAQALAARDGLVAEALLWRAPWARRQAGRTDAARRTDPHRLGLRAVGHAPSSVVLVDDVRTTGATLDVAASLLRAAGTSRIVAITATAVTPLGGWPEGHIAGSSGGR